MADSGLSARGGGGCRPRGALRALALSLVFASGCHAYADVSPAAAPPGSDVRLRLAPGSAVGVGTMPMPDDGRLLLGKVVAGTSADRLLLAVAVEPGEPGSPSLGLRSTVTVPVSEVERMEVRRLQKRRTAVAVGVGALLAYVATDWAFNVSNPNKPGSVPGGENNARLVRFRLRW